MAQAARDENYVTTLMGVSLSDLITPEKVAVDPANNRLLVSAIITNETTAYAVKLDDTSTASVTYIGKAAVGSSGASAVWQIQKMDESSGLVITFADGDSSFNNIWNNRTSLSYS